MMENKDNNIIEDTQKIFEEMEAALEEIGDDEFMDEFRKTFNPEVPSGFPTDASDDDKVAWLKTRFTEELAALPKDPTAGEVNAIYQNYKQLIGGMKNPLKLQKNTVLNTYAMPDKILRKKKLAVPEESTKRKRTTLEKHIKMLKSDIKICKRKLHEEKLTPEEQIQIKEDIKITQSLITSSEEDLMNLENQVFVPESFDMPEKSSKQLFKEIQAPARRKKYADLPVVAVLIAIVIIAKIYFLKE